MEHEDLILMGRFMRKCLYFGGDGIGNCENEVHMNVCVTVNGYRDRAV
jgi:hypothetical protein